MKEERIVAEKRFWQVIATMALESGLEPEWEYLGTTCSRRRLHDLIERFQNDPTMPGFYGIRVTIGELNGIRVNVLIENQKDLIIGIQPDDSPFQGNGVTLETYHDLMEELMATGRSWNYEAPGWIAWKTAGIHLNFRSLFNRAFQDILLKKSNSEALYLIAEEISDILSEIRNILIRQNVVYGALIA